MIQKGFEGLAGIINRSPLLVAACIVAVIGIAAYGITCLSMQTGWETYMDKDTTRGFLYNEYSRTFESESVILIVETSDVMDPAILTYIDRLEKTIRQQQGVRSVLAMPDVLRGYNGNVLPASPGEVEAAITRIPEGLLSAYRTSDIMTLVQISVTEGLSTGGKDDVLQNIEAVVRDSDPPPGVSVSVTGSSAFTRQMSSELSRSMGVLIGAAMVLMVIVMGVLFAYVRHRFLPVVAVAIGLVTAMGLMGLAGIGLNMAVVGAFPVLIGLGIDYAIQFHARLDEEARKGSLPDAVFTTITRTGPAVLYAMLATCMGFLAMFISPVPMVRSFGLVSIIGVMSCYVVSLVGIPTIAILLKYRPKPEKTGECYAVGTGACDFAMETGKKKRRFSYGDFLTRSAVSIAKNPLPILLVASLIAVAGYYIDPMIGIQTNENSFVPADMPAKFQLDKVGRIIGETGTVPLYVTGGVTDLDTVQWLDRFGTYETEHTPVITSATSIATIVLSYNNNKMPETQAELDRVLASIPDDIRKQYLSGTTTGVVQFRTEKMEMPERNSLKEALLRDLTFVQPPPGVTVKPTGGFDLYTTLMGDLSESKELMTYLGFVLIFIFLVLVYRHLHAITPLVPIILIVGWNAVAMFVIGLEYTPLTATLGSMTIGVAAEYTILVMERYGEERERLGNSFAAIEESVRKIGTAITVSGLATFFGFSALLFAAFPIISNFGISTLIAVGFSLIGAIFIMPAALSVMGRFERTKARAPETQAPVSQ